MFIVLAIILSGAIGFGLSLVLPAVVALPLSLVIGIALGYVAAEVSA